MTDKKKPLVTISFGQLDEHIITWLNQFPFSKKSFFFAQRMEDVLSGKEKGELTITRPPMDNRNAKVMHVHYREEFQLTNRYINWLSKRPELGSLSNSLKLLINGVILDTTGHEWTKESSHYPDLSLFKRKNRSTAKRKTITSQASSIEFIKNTIINNEVAVTTENIAQTTPTTPSPIERVIPNSEDIQGVDTFNLNASTIHHASSAPQVSQSHGTQDITQAPPIITTHEQTSAKQAVAPVLQDARPTSAINPMMAQRADKLTQLKKSYAQE